MKYLSEEKSVQKDLLDRFIKYVKIWTESDSAKADEGVMPSTERQRDLAEILSAEMKLFGMQGVQTTESCYTYGFLPSSEGCEDVPSFCVLAHIDTVEEVTGRDVKPIIHTGYDGAKIFLNCDVCLDPEFDEALSLASKNNETIITSDGTTLLGADDKAGVAEIMTFIQYLVGHPELKHGKIEVLFSPDEETGHGMDKVPLQVFSSKFAYTVDGGNIGELETECFNAYSATVTFNGKSTHTGDALKGGMINAISMASKFVEMIPMKERPETTCGYEGFYAVLEMNGSVEQSTVYVLLRDFTTDGMERRIDFIDSLSKVVASSFGGTCKVEFKEQYKNMKAVLNNHPEVVDNLIKAYKESGVEPVFKPIRGGTDGSRLTEMGIPTPNIFTGGHNYHSRSEWASLEQMCAACDVLINLSQAVMTK